MTASVAEAPSKSGVPYRPSLRDMVMLETPVAVKVSPGGRRIAMTIRTTYWKENRYENVCHVHDVASGTTYPLNRTGSALQIEWLDDDSLGLLKQERGEDGKAQVFVYEGLTGDGWAVTDHKTGVDWFKPFAGGLLYRARDAERDENKPRASRFGKFTRVEQEDSPSALYYVGLEELRRYQAQVKAATEDEAKELVAPVIELSRLLPERLAIREVVPSPAGDALYVNTWKREDWVFFRDTRVYCIRLDARAAVAEQLCREKARREEKEERTGEEVTEGTSAERDLAYLGDITRLHVPRAASVACVAPDGRQLAVLYQERDDKMYTRTDLWLIDTQAALDASDPDAFLGAMRNISAALDQELLEVYWVASGLFAACPEGTRTQAVRLAGDGQFARLDLQGVSPLPVLCGFHAAAVAEQIALIGASATTIPEVYLAEPAGDGGQYRVRPLTACGQAVDGWELGTVETIRWTSRDGTEIEGVLRKPVDFDPTRRYPLVFVVHGGPSWFSAEILMGGEERGYYPSVQFVNKGVLVLKPNYRGSIGRGQAFAELNVNNLGIGDLWDLESAIDHLAALGWVDAERVGCMGWSQGGYISAFAGLHSGAFRGAPSERVCRIGTRTTLATTSPILPWTISLARLFASASGTCRRLP